MLEISYHGVDKDFLGPMSAVKSSKSMFMYIISMMHNLLTLITSKLSKSAFLQICN